MGQLTFDSFKLVLDKEIFFVLCPECGEATKRGSTEYRALNGVQVRPATNMSGSVMALMETLVSSYKWSLFGCVCLIP